MILPNEKLVGKARSFNLPSNLQVLIGGLADALSQSTVAIASSGTVTLECAYFGVPTVAMVQILLVQLSICQSDCEGELPRNAEPAG